MAQSSAPNESGLIAELNDLLQLDHDAVEAYTIAIDLVRSTRFRDSLVEHRASVEGRTPVSPQNLLRISVGLEYADDLIADWMQALA